MRPIEATIIRVAAGRKLRVNDHPVTSVSPVIATPRELTQALRLFASKHAVAPGDWPTDTAHVPLWSYAPEFDQ